MEEIIGQTGYLGIPIFVEVSNADSKGGFLKDILMISFGAGLTALVTFANYFFVHASTKRTKRKQFSNELADIDSWCKSAIKIYSRCQASLSGVPMSVSLEKASKKDVSHFSSFYWSISADPASMIDSFRDVNKRYGVRYFYLWFDNVQKDNETIKEMIHNYDVFKNTTRSEAEDNYGRMVFSLVMLMKHISLYKNDEFKNYLSFKDSDKKLDEAFMKNIESDIGISLPRWY